MSYQNSSSDYLVGSIPKLYIKSIVLESDQLHSISNPLVNYKITLNMCIKDSANDADSFIMNYLKNPAAYNFLQQMNYDVAMDAKLGSLDVAGTSQMMIPKEPNTDELELEKWLRRSLKYQVNLHGEIQKLAQSGTSAEALLQTDVDGNKFYEIPIERSFNFSSWNLPGSPLADPDAPGYRKGPSNIQNLSFQIQPYVLITDDPSHFMEVDLPDWAAAPPVDVPIPPPGGFLKVSGRKTQERVIQDFKIVPGYIFRGPSGKIYRGPVHQMSSGEWHPGATHEEYKLLRPFALDEGPTEQGETMMDLLTSPESWASQTVNAAFYKKHPYFPATLTLQETENLKVQDMRVIVNYSGNIGMLHHWSAAKIEADKKLISDKMAFSDQWQSVSSYFSDILMSRDTFGNCRYFFSIDFANLIKANSKYPVIWHRIFFDDLSPEEEVEMRKIRAKILDWHGKSGKAEAFAAINQYALKRQKVDKAEWKDRASRVLRRRAGRLQQAKIETGFLKHKTSFTAVGSEGHKWSSKNIDDTVIVTQGTSLGDAEGKIMTYGPLTATGRYGGAPFTEVLHRDLMDVDDPGIKTSWGSVRKIRHFTGIDTEIGTRRDDDGLYSYTFEMRLQDKISIYLNQKLNNLYLAIDLLNEFHMIATPHFNSFTNLYSQRFRKSVESWFPPNSLLETRAPHIFPIIAYAEIVELFARPLPAEDPHSLETVGTQMANLINPIKTHSSPQGILTVVKVLQEMASLVQNLIDKAEYSQKRQRMTSSGIKYSSMQGTGPSEKDVVITHTFRKLFNNTITDKTGYDYLSSAGAYYGGNFEFHYDPPAEQDSFGQSWPDWKKQTGLYALNNLEYFDRTDIDQRKLFTNPAASVNIKETDMEWSEANQVAVVKGINESTFSTGEEYTKDDDPNNSRFSFLAPTSVNLFGKDPVNFVYPLSIYDPQINSQLIVDVVRYNMQKRDINERGSLPPIVMEEDPLKLEPIEQYLRYSLEDYFRSMNAVVMGPATMPSKIIITDTSHTVESGLTQTPSAGQIGNTALNDPLGIGTPTTAMGTNKILAPEIYEKIKLAILNLKATSQFTHMHELFNSHSLWILMHAFRMTGDLENYAFSGKYNKDKGFGSKTLEWSNITNTTEAERYSHRVIDKIVYYDLLPSAMNFSPKDKFGGGDLEEFAIWAQDKGINDPEWSIYGQFTTEEGTDLQALWAIDKVKQIRTSFIKSLPNHLKALLMCRSENHQNLVMNWFRVPSLAGPGATTKNNYAGPLACSNPFWFGTMFLHYHNLMEVEVFAGYEQSPTGGQPMMNSPIWKRLTLERYKDLYRGSAIKGRGYLCRLKQYTNRPLGYKEPPVELRLPVFNEYFFLYAATTAQKKKWDQEKTAPTLPGGIAGTTAAPGAPTPGAGPGSSAAAGSTKPAPGSIASLVQKLIQSTMLAATIPSEDQITDIVDPSTPKPTTAMAGDTIQPPLPMGPESGDY